MSTTRRSLSGSRLNNASATLDIATSTTQEAISQWGMVRKRTALGIGLNMAWQSGGNATYANTHSYNYTKAPISISCHCRYIVLRSPDCRGCYPTGQASPLCTHSAGCLNVVSSRRRLSRGKVETWLREEANKTERRNERVSSKAHRLLMTYLASSRRDFGRQQARRDSNRLRALDLEWPALG